MKFKDVIKDLPLDKQNELIEWRKKSNKISALLITFLVFEPGVFIAFMAGHWFGGWLH